MTGHPHLLDLNRLSWMCGWTLDDSTMKFEKTKPDQNNKRSGFVAFFEVHLIYQEVTIGFVKLIFLNWNY